MPMNFVDALTETLAELYPREAEQKRVLKAVEIRFAAVPWYPVGLDTWSGILDYAAKHKGMIEKIIAKARQEFADNETLILLEKSQQKAQVERVRGPSVVWWHGDDEPSENLERITGSRSTLVAVRYLALGMRCADAVCKIELADGRGSGTGFLVSDNMLVTNNHVLRDAETARGARVLFNYQQTPEGPDAVVDVRQLLPGARFKTSVEDDFTIVKVDGNPNERWGALKLAERPIERQQRVTIIQHPSGGPKQLSLLANVVVYQNERIVQYLTDTLPGSSGSPVFNENWEVVALHHSGGWLKEPNSTDKAAFLRNEGIQIDVVRRALDP